MRFLRSLILAVLLVGGFVYFTGKPNSFVRRNFSTPGALWSEPQVAHSAGLGSDEQNNIDIYKAAKDSVVYITSTVLQRRFFFDEQGHAVGSGFLINSDGQILTNFHVISGSSDVEVTLPDQTIYKAKMLVRDRPDDLALIKIEPKKKLSAFESGRFRSFASGTEGAGDRAIRSGFAGDADGGRGQLAGPPHPERE